ncbi:MAG: phosphate signaling complex PhoU family protein [bacterium]
MTKEMQALLDDFTTLGNIALEMLRLASDAYFSGDPEPANQVLNLEKQLNRKEVEMEEKCQSVLTIYKLDAYSVRLALSILKATVDLERVGDFCFKMAKRALERLKPLQHPQADSLKKLSRVSSSMLYDAFQSFIQQDQMLARNVGPQDPEADNLKNLIISEIRSRCKQATCTDQDLEILQTAQDLERIADHATNIAEETLVLPTGSVQRHTIRSERERL